MLSSCYQAAAQGRELLGARAGQPPAGSARYIGILGSRLRTEQILADCRVAGVPVDGAALSRVHAPVGMQLGAQTPAEIVLAIVAEVQGIFARLDATR